METIETETKLCMILDGLDSYLSELYDASIQGTACQKVLSDEEQGAVVGLFNSCHETEKSLVILLRHNQVFDAIALMRSLAEGSVRALYMLSPSLDEVHSRIKEYMEELPRDTYVNIGKRARSINDQVPNRDDDYRKMIDELAQLGRDGTLDEIRKRWSFANIFKNQKSEEWGGCAFVAHSDTLRTFKRLATQRIYDESITFRDRTGYCRLHEFDYVPVI